MWLSPRQVAVIPIAVSHVPYAHSIGETLQSSKLYMDVFGDDKTLNKRIREAQLLGYNYILVVGDQEVENRTVNVRSRDKTMAHGTAVSVDEFLNHIHSVIQAEKTLPL